MPQLARQMIERAGHAGVPFSWVAADEVYGGNPGLREWLEKEEISYVLTTPFSSAACWPRTRMVRGQPAHGGHSVALRLPALRAGAASYQR